MNVNETKPCAIQWIIFQDPERLASKDSFFKILICFQIISITCHCCSSSSSSFSSSSLFSLLSSSFFLLLSSSRNQTKLRSMCLAGRQPCFVIVHVCCSTCFRSSWGAGTCTQYNGKNVKHPKKNCSSLLRFAQIRKLPSITHKIHYVNIK